MQYSPSSKFTQKSTVRSDGVDVLSYSIINHASWGIYPTILYILWYLFRYPQHCWTIWKITTRVDFLSIILEYTVAQYRSVRITYAQFCVLNTVLRVQICQQS